MSISLGVTHPPLTKVVTANIRQRIMSGDIALGTRLVEGRLSEELGVSRMPVREALRELAAEGIVTIEPRRGASVTTFSDEQKRELVEVRATLEALNARLAAKHHDARHMTRLQKILEEGRKLEGTEDTSKIVGMNAKFHEALAVVSGNSVVAGHDAPVARPHRPHLRFGQPAPRPRELAGARRDPARGDRWRCGTGGAARHPPRLQCRTDRAGAVSAVRRRRCRR